jgi:prophage regulatory protein
MPTPLQQPVKVTATNPRFGRRPEVSAVTGFSRPTLYSRMADGLFPRPVKLGAKFAAWPMDEVAAVLNAHIAGKTPDEVKALVAELTDARKFRV